MIRALFSDAALGRAGRDPGRAAVPARWRASMEPAPVRAGRSAHLARRAGTARFAPRSPLRGRLELRLEPRRDARGVHRASRPVLRAECEAIGRDPDDAHAVGPDHHPGGRRARRAAPERAIAYGRAGASEILLTTPAREGAAGIRRLATEVAAPLRDDLRLRLPRSASAAGESVASRPSMSASVER